MYMEAEIVDSIFTFVAQHTDRGSRCAFTFLEQHKNGKINFRRGSKIIDLWLKWRGEDFRWGVRRREMEQYLVGRGVSLRTIANEQVLRKRYLNKATKRSYLARGEYIAIAERG
jgi:O-methyltransferase involved in polyketide biosynthesis